MAAVFTLFLRIPGCLLVNPNENLIGERADSNIRTKWKFVFNCIIQLTVTKRPFNAPPILSCGGASRAGGWLTPRTQKCSEGLQHTLRSSHYPPGNCTERLSAVGTPEPVSSLNSQLSPLVSERGGRLWLKSVSHGNFLPRPSPVRRKLPLTVLG